MIAKINDTAYKAIQSTGMQKMIDKRALANESLYEKLENEVAKLSSKFDFNKLR